jgi:hypothetical protein
MRLVVACNSGTRLLSASPQEIIKGWNLSFTEWQAIVSMSDIKSRGGLLQCYKLKTTIFY